MQAATLLIAVCSVLLHHLWRRQPPTLARQRQKPEGFGLDFYDGIKSCGANCTKDEVINLASEQVRVPTHHSLSQPP